VSWQYAGQPVDQCDLPVIETLKLDLAGIGALFSWSALRRPTWRISSGTTRR